MFKMMCLYVMCYILWRHLLNYVYQSNKKMGKGLVVICKRSTHHYTVTPQSYKDTNCIYVSHFDQMLHGWCDALSVVSSIILRDNTAYDAKIQFRQQRQAFYVSLSCIFVISLAFLVRVLCCRKMVIKIYTCYRLMVFN